MYQSEFVKKCEGVAEYWGKQMPMMTMEECAELIQAISKFERFLNGRIDSETFAEEYRTVKENLIEEIGDVHISIMALMAHYAGTITPEDLDAYIEKKLGKRY